MASITDILRSDPRGLNEAQLRRQVQQLADAANKRLRRLAEKNITSPAEAGRKREGGGMFSTKGKNYNQLQAEFKRAKEYLEAKTSTIKGAKQFQQDVLKQTNTRLDANMNEKQAKNFWSTMSKVMEQVPQTTLQQAGLSSYDVQKRVYEMQQAGITDPVEIADMLLTYTNDIFETMEDWDEWDGFFET